MMFPFTLRALSPVSISPFCELSLIRVGRDLLVVRPGYVLLGLLRGSQVRGVLSPCLFRLLAPRVDALVLPVIRLRVALNVVRVLRIWVILRWVTVARLTGWILRLPFVRWFILRLIMEEPREYS